jgi:hypothetical protein
MPSPEWAVVQVQTDAKKKKTRNNISHRGFSPLAETLYNAALQEILRLKEENTTRGNREGT